MFGGPWFFLLVTAIFLINSPGYSASARADIRKKGLETIAPSSLDEMVLKPGGAIGAREVDN